jgi:hypothetical protein
MGSTFEEDIRSWAGKELINRIEKNSSQKKIFMF